MPSVWGRWRAGRESGSITRATYAALGIADYVRRSTEIKRGSPTSVSARFWS